MIGRAASGLRPRRALRLATRRRAGFVPRVPLRWRRRLRLRTAAVLRPTLALHWALHLRVDAAEARLAAVAGRAAGFAAAPTARPAAAPPIERHAARLMERHTTPLIERQFASQSNSELPWRATATIVAHTAAGRASTGIVYSATPRSSEARPTAVRGETPYGRRARVEGRPLVDHALTLHPRPQRRRRRAPPTVEREPAAAAVAARQQRIELVWRRSAAVTAAEAAAPAFAAAVQAATAPGREPIAACWPPAAAAAARAAALDPGLADRLADDVIRRVERRVRIQRERRGQ